MSSAASGVQREQRFSASKPCPVCEGHSGLPSGIGQRCYGFISRDGKYAHCTREEYAEHLDRSPQDNTFSHKLEGRCTCGTSHGLEPAQMVKLSGRNGGRKVAKVYNYTNLAGKILHQTVKYEPKGFSQRCPASNGDYTWSLKGVDTVLYRLPEVAKAIKEDKAVLVVEGEGDVDAAYEKLGIVATTNPMGVGKWRESYTEQLRGAKKVVIIPDNDRPGQEHAESVAAQVSMVAESVKILTLPGLGNGGDLYDWISDGGTPEQLRELVKATPQWIEEDESIYSHPIHGGFGENKNPLPIKSVGEVIEEAEESRDWIIEDVLARGALTEFSGLAKKGGKTTIWCHAIAAGANGQDHAGFHTEAARYLYLTEQCNNFAQALEEARLVDYPDHISIIQFKDVSSVQWNTLMQQAGQEAKRCGFDVLVIDTFAVFAGLKGSEENDSGPVADRMRVLRLVAQKYNIAVVLIRHAGKDGTPRGSSAFEAEADICVTLARPEGRHAPSARRIARIGRYGEWERNIQLQDGRYISLGTDDKIEFNKAVTFIKAVIPDSPDTGLRKQEILDKRTGPDKEISARTIERALERLLKEGAIGGKQLINQRGKPKVYWRAYNPPRQEVIHSRQTPPPNGKNKSETNPQDSKEEKLAEFRGLLTNE